MHICKHLGNAVKQIIMHTDVPHIEEVSSLTASTMQKVLASNLCEVNNPSCLDETTVQSLPVANCQAYQTMTQPSVDTYLVLNFGCSFHNRCTHS